MDNKVNIGAYGQKLAENYLTSNGFTIIERNFRCRSGEIDVVAWDDDYIAFIEVKYRRSLTHGYPREAVGYHKQKHIRRVASYYIMTKQLSNQDFRFDVLEIVDIDGNPEITLIKNAF